jgi:GT2 family glycosyltransferase
MRFRAGIIVAQYGQGELTVECLRSFYACHAPETPIVVVDDGSPRQEDVRPLQDLKWAGCHVIRCSQNRGVTSAWNRGARFLNRYYPCDVLVFLNNDTLTHGPWLEALSDPVLNRETLLAGVHWRRERRVPEKLQQQWPLSRFLEGWCFALRTDLFLALDGFERRLRLYFSDTDLQLRAAQQSVSTVPHTHDLLIVPNLPLQHLAHQTTQRELTRQEQWHADRKRFLARWSRYVAEE